LRSNSCTPGWHGELDDRANLVSGNPDAIEDAVIGVWELQAGK
jgi:hypothetical protein